MGVGVGEAVAVGEGPGVRVALPPCGVGAAPQDASKIRQSSAQAAHRRRESMQVPFWACHRSQASWVARRKHILSLGMLQIPRQQPSHFIGHIQQGQVHDRIGTARRAENIRQPFMATKKTPTPPKRPTPSNVPSSRKTATPHRQPTTSQSASSAEHQTPTRSPRRRRRQTFGQRLTHLSAGSWFAILTGALVIGIIAFAIIASRGSTPTVSPSATGLLPTGTPAPAIAALPAATGQSYSLAQYKGQKVVVLEFFAPWCPHCQNETATLKQLQQKYGAKGVQVLSVSASPYGRSYESGDQTPISMSDIQWFSKTFGLNYPALFDPSLKAGNAYGVQAFPTIYVVNKQGVITYAGNGEISYASLQQQVNAALGQ